MPKMTEGRITEPVEVVRIRRAYTQQGIGDKRQGQGGKMKESLLERVNRRRRAQVQGWRITRLSSPLSHVRSTSLIPTQATAVVVVPLNDEAIELRLSLRRTISARIPSVKSTRKGGNPTLTPKSRFAFHWNKYESKEPEVLRELLQNLELVRKDERGKYSSHYLRQRSPCHSQAPSPLRRTNSLTAGHASVSSSPIYLFVHAGSTLSTLASSIARKGHSYMSPRSNVNSVPNSRRSSRFLSPIAQVPNRLSVVSMVSCNSAISGISSMANSIYSFLSEDWNRPFFFARSKSHRCPTSLQDNVRALPHYGQLTTPIVTTSIQRGKTGTQMIAATRGVRSRGLRNPDGSVFQLTPEHDLYSADIRIIWRQVIENFVVDDDDLALAISRSCLSALSKARDRFGFVDYKEEGNQDEEEIQAQIRHTGGPDAVNILKSQCGIHSGFAGTDDWTLVDSGRSILDVNDTSAMIAAGIDPSEPHPNPETFYHLHHPTEHQANIHDEPQETSAAMDTFHCSDSHNVRHSPASNGLIDDSTFLQNFHSVLSGPASPLLYVYGGLAKVALFRNGSANL